MVISVVISVIMVISVVVVIVFVMVVSVIVPVVFDEVRDVIGDGEDWNAIEHHGIDGGGQPLFEVEAVDHQQVGITHQPTILQ